MIVACKDHLGNEYSSQSKMCENYGITVSTFGRRLKRGATLQEALTLSTLEFKRRFPRAIDIDKRTDQKGNQYASIDAMCQAYNIEPVIYRNRLNKGWSKERALTTPKGDSRHKDWSAVEVEERTDHTGRVFESLKEMCSYWGITVSAYRHRRESGETKEDSLTKGMLIDVATVNKTDHLGNVYDSIASMCKYWSIPYSQYCERTNKLHWSKEKALETLSLAKLKGFFPHIKLYRKCMETDFGIYYICRCQQCNELQLWSSQDIRRHQCNIERS